MSLDTIIAALKAILNNGRIASDEEWEATAEAILYLERLKRLDERLTKETKDAGQHYDHIQAAQEWAFGVVLNYLRTGEEW